MGKELLEGKRIRVELSGFISGLSDLRLRDLSLVSELLRHLHEVGLLG